MLRLPTGLFKSSKQAHLQSNEIKSDMIGTRYLIVLIIFARSASGVDYLYHSVRRLQMSKKEESPPL